MNILIAEDDRISLRMLKRQLEKWGHQTLTAGNGAEAWELFKENNCPLVLTDWEMPEMNGVELVRLIRESANGSGYVYIILLTARSEKEDIVKGMEAGADDFVTKPFDKEELRVRVRAGERLIELERNLARQNDMLDAANQRMKRDLDFAAEIQQAFLPAKIPNCPGANFAWAFNPCDELAGDTLNIIPVDDSHVAFYVVDVSGHGVPAALLSVSLSHSLCCSDEASVLIQPDDSPQGFSIVPPAEVATKLNNRFVSTDKHEQYFTLIYGILNLNSNEFRFTCAGHPPPVWVSKSGESGVLDACGFPIGLVEGTFDEHSRCLASGDRLYFYSDGVPEAANPCHELFGTERLVDSLQDSHSHPLQDSVSRLINHVNDWRGMAPVEDDISVLGVEVV